MIEISGVLESRILPVEILEPSIEVRVRVTDETEIAFEAAERRKGHQR